METKNRIESIDLTRGMGILLVVLGHLNTDEQIGRYLIYSFHIPLFFVLSGTLLHFKNDFFSELKKIIYTLYVPYILMVFANLPLMISVSGLNIKEALPLCTIQVLKYAVGIGCSDYNVAIWFLFALFVVKLLYLFIYQIQSKKTANRLLLIIALLCIMFVLARPQLELPKDILYISSIPGFAFFTIGYFLRDYIKNIQEQIKSTKIHLYIAPIMTVLLVVLVSQNKMVDMRLYHYPNPILYLVNSCIGCYITIVFCSYLASCKSTSVTKIKNVINYYGKNSIIVLITHYFPEKLLTKIIFSAFKITNYGIYLLLEMLILIIILLIMIPIIWFFNKHLFFIIGRKSNNS